MVLLIIGSRDVNVPGRADKVRPVGSYRPKRAESSDQKTKFTIKIVRNLPSQIFI